MFHNGGCLHFSWISGHRTQTVNILRVQTFKTSSYKKKTLAVSTHPGFWADFFQTLSNNINVWRLLNINGLNKLLES